MSKLSLSGLTGCGQSARRGRLSAPTEPERQKLAKSAMRPGWDAFAAALQTLCEEGARNCRLYHPGSAGVWERRAQLLRELGNHG